MNAIYSQPTEPKTTFFGQQSKSDFVALNAIEIALQGTLETHAVGSLPRKLASVRFATSSLQNCAERLFAWEERTGFMADVAEQHPHLTRKIKRLRREQLTLRQSFRRIIAQLESLAPNDAPAFDALCQKLSTLIDRLDCQMRSEEELLEDAYLQDTGGEGGS